MANSPTNQKWPDISPEFASAHPEVAQAIRLLYMVADDHSQAFSALKPQVDTAQKTATTAIAASKVVAGVSSVGLQMPPEFQVNGSPVVSAGTLQASWGTEPANAILAGPVSGGDAQPSFRLAVPADLPIATTSAVGAVKPDGVTIDVAVDGTIDVPIATTSDVGVVKPDGTTITIDVDGTIHAASFDAATEFEFFDDFASVINTSPFSNAWNSTQQWIRSGSDTEYPDWSIASFIGAIRIHSPAGGQEAMYSNNSPGTPGHYLTTYNDKTFDFKVRFAYGDFTDKIVYNIGLSDGGVQFVSNLIALYSDQNNSPNFHYLVTSGGTSTYVDSGIAVDTNPHVLRIRSTTPGEILFSLDGGTETMINTNVPTVALNMAMGVGTYGTTTADHNMYLDYVSLKITGLTR